jgi:hypothetical protein
VLASSALVDPARRAVASFGLRMATIRADRDVSARVSAQPRERSPRVLVRHVTPTKCGLAGWVVAAGATIQRKGGQGPATAVETPPGACSGGLLLPFGLLPLPITPIDDLNEFDSALGSDGPCYTPAHCDLACTIKCRGFSEVEDREGGTAGRSRGFDADIGRCILALYRSAPHELLLELGAQPGTRPPARGLW